jgi:uridine kinase
VTKAQRPKRTDREIARRPSFRAPPPTNPPVVVGIVGGSGSGKTWLAEKLAAGLPTLVARFSLDDFYRDRSHLPAGRRANLNFDHPLSIDWPAFRRALTAASRGRPARVPRYDFKTHCRVAGWQSVAPKPIILVDGLWLWRSPALRRLFTWRIFLDCPPRVRLRRRLVRDRRLRGRTPASVREQFRKTVEPMHRKFVMSQQRWADVILAGNWGQREIKKLVALLKLHFSGANRQQESTNPAED